MTGSDNANISSAQKLAREGRLADARALLEEAAMNGDGASGMLIGTLLLTGQPYGRDLGAARRWFKAAAEAGNEEGVHAWIAFQANGTGGTRDWHGALDWLREHSPTQLQLIEAMALDADGESVQEIVREAAPELPEAAHFPNFLSGDECAFLIEGAQGAMQPSMVIDPRTGSFVADPIRRSDVAPFPLVSESPFIHAINRRIARATRTNVSQGEPLQVLRYADGQEYRQHLDAIPNAENQREFTFLIYLNEGYAGGETVFPNAGLTVRGKAGDAFLFRNTVDGDPDPVTAHIGKPVTEGVKYLASRWIRARPLDLSL